MFGPAIFGDHLLQKKALKFRARFRWTFIVTYYSSIIRGVGRSCVLNSVGLLCRFTGQLIDVAALEAIGVGLWRIVSK